MNHERLKFMKRSLENEGAHPFLEGARAPIISGGSSTHLFKGARAPIIRRANKREQMNEHK